MMKKFGLLSFMIATLISVTAQDTISKGEYTIFYYPNGKPSSEGYMENGHPNGWWKSYNEEGVLRSEGNRKEFQLDSIWRFYNDKGEPTLEVNYLKGTRNGRRVQYFKDETIVDFWHLDTLVDGVYVYYYPDSILKKYTPYENGRPHGMEKQFDKFGTVTAVAVYYRGALLRREFINRTDQFGYKQGNWKFFWDNGNLQMEGTYQNDKKNGFFKYYDEHGDFLFVEKYAMDRLVEDAPETKVLEKKTTYHPNGKPAITATFYKGVPEGIRREYDTNGVVIRGYVFESGVLRFEGVTDQDGKRQGVWKEYYPTGELRSEGRYQNSLMVGEWKFYFENKTIEMIGIYDRRGRKQGEWNWFYPDGSLLLLENYEAGDLEGEYVAYNEEGKEIAKGAYIENEKEGEWEYDYGNSREQGSYYDGKRQGVWRVWYENGQLVSEYRYDQDMPDGKFTTYWENGRVKETGRYQGGERNGTWMKYDEDGNLSLTTIYKDGVEVMWNSYKITDKF